MKALIEIPDSQIEKLAVVCERMDVSRSEIIREAIAEYLKKHHYLESADEEVYGLWKNREAGGVVYQHRIRSEWED